MRLPGRTEEPPPSRVVSALTGSDGWGKLKTTVMVIGGLAGVTAASAGISALRRREDGTRDGS